MFYLGTHEPGWLRRPGMPRLFISHRRLARLGRLPRAATRWALDSGAYSELAANGRWEVTPDAYADAVGRYAEQVGRLQWATPQDWLCVPPVLAKTGLTVADHQARTVASLVELRHLQPAVPWVPVLQGWTADDYLACADLYDTSGVDLAGEPLVGVGSIAARQHQADVEDALAALAARGLRLHGFGVKLQGLARYGRLLASADSMAWSYDARRRPPMDGCSHAQCQNCARYALAWRATAVAAMGRPQQLTFAG